MRFLQKLGRALMQAVAVLPVAALLMGIGYALDSQGWGAGSPVASVFLGAGIAVLDNIGIIFAIAVAYGLSKDKDGAAALSGYVGFAVVTTLLNPKSVANIRGSLHALVGMPADQAAAMKEQIMHQISVVEGFAKMNGGNVFVGIIIGIVAAAIYNKFSKTKLPDFLAFFSGRRLVPILTSFAAIGISAVLLFLWPVVYSGLIAFGTSIQSLGALGAGLFGFFNRLLIPTGLHHALNAVFWQNIIGINDITNFLTNAPEAVRGVTGMYQAGFFPIMMWGLPGAALAMYQTAKPGRKKEAFALLFAASLTSIVTGVTEPIEFAFMFLAPVLYLVHAILTGVSMFIAASFGWIAGFGFSAGAIDYVLSIFNPLAKDWYMLIPLGIFFFIVYWAIFRLFIKMFNLKTPGREDEADESEGRQFDIATTDFTAMAETIVTGLGGKENIDSIEHCVTRLRVVVKDELLVNEKVIKNARVSGVIRPSQKNVQVVVGPQVQFVYDEIKRL